MQAMYSALFGEKLYSITWYLRFGWLSRWLPMFTLVGSEKKEKCSCLAESAITFHCCHFYVITIRGQQTFIDWSTVWPIIFSHIQSLVQHSSANQYRDITSYKCISSLIIQSISVWFYQFTRLVLSG